MSNQCLWLDSGQILCHQHGISVSKSQTFLLAQHPPAATSEEKRMFSHWLAGNWIVKMSLWFYFTFVCYEWLVVMGYQDFNKVLSRWQKLWSRQRWKKLTPVSRAVSGASPLENVLNLDLLEYISSILEQNTNVIKFWFFYSAISHE